MGQLDAIPFRHRPPSGTASRPQSLLLPRLLGQVSARDRSFNPRRNGYIPETTGTGCGQLADDDLVQSWFELPAMKRRRAIFVIPYRRSVTLVSAHPSINMLFQPNTRS